MTENEQDEFIERRILIGLIMKGKYLERAQPFADDLERLLATKWSRLGRDDISVFERPREHVTDLLVHESGVCLDVVDPTNEMGQGRTK